MTNHSFPTVAAYPLPVATLRAPLQEKADAPAPAAPPSTNHEAAAEALAPLISAAIARRARQRRYTG